MIFDRVYASDMNIDRLGSIDELYETVKEAFAQDPNDAGSWGPRYVCSEYSTVPFRRTESKKTDALHIGAQMGWLIWENLLTTRDTQK